MYGIVGVKGALGNDQDTVKSLENKFDGHFFVTGVSLVAAVTGCDFDSWVNPSTSIFGAFSFIWDTRKFTLTLYHTIYSAPMGPQSLKLPNPTPTPASTAIQLSIS